MQELIDARAGLNGSGAGYDAAPIPDMETMSEMEELALAAAEPARRPSPVRDAIRADPVRYAEVKRLVTGTTLSLKTISEQTGIAYTTLRNLIGEERWERLAHAPKRPAMPDGSPVPRKRLARDISDMAMVQARLLRALDRQIDKVELRLKRKAAEVEEKDSRILGNLAKTLGTLMQMGAGGKTSNHAEPPDRDEDVEARLAERIKRWARGEQGY